MSPFDEGSTPKDRAIELIAKEIAKADYDRVPTSRQKLGQLVSAAIVIAPAEAYKIVDEYCDERAPGVPHYLQDEFKTPYMKWLGVVNAIAGVAVLWYAAHAWRVRGLSWPYFIVGAILIALAGFFLLRTVQAEQVAESQ